jgi:uncharacterized protein YdeI (YjbR/CyaY-like superfamily)
MEAQKSEDTLQFSLQAEWAQWLAAQHAASKGVWLRHAKDSNKSP